MEKCAARMQSQLSGSPATGRDFRVQAINPTHLALDEASDSDAFDPPAARLFLFGNENNRNDTETVELRMASHNPSLSVRIKV